MKVLCLICWLLPVSLCCQAQTEAKMTGITLVAPRDSFVTNPFSDIKAVNADWVALVPYAFTPRGSADLVFNSPHQWWGETPGGLESSVHLAKASGLKIMIKPQVWMHGQWIGDLEYNNDSEWQRWEEQYREYILTFAAIAERHEVELFCIGTEVRKSAIEREAFWRLLIEDVRKVYGGKVSYCANWDNFENIPFWDAVDLVGISAYFPLTDTSTPDVEELVQHWKPIEKRISRLSRSLGGKGVFFAEFGYMSVDGAAGKTWELEDRRQALNPNEKAQANAIEAVLLSFCDASYWKGCFLWKWYPNNGRKPSFKERDYTPQGKQAEHILTIRYKEINTDSKP